MMRAQPVRRAALLALLASATCVTAASPKLGWGGGDAPDHNASNSSWYYRWWHDIPASAAGTLAEFVPLIKYPTDGNLQNNLTRVANLPDVDTLLFLNEPERETQSDRTVAEALDFWPVVQARLPNHRIVGPGTGDDGGGRAWLADFMNAVEARNANATPTDDIRVDAIAFHWYGAQDANAVGAANTFLSRVDWYHQEYNRPVWITEFAMHDWNNNDTTEAMLAANAQFLDIVIPELESRSYVERYAYYNWFDDARVFDPASGADRMPTVVGDAFVGTTGVGEVRDLGGVSLGDDIAYLRGGQLTNTGPALPDAMRAIDVLEGVGTISGTTDWSMADRPDGYARVRPGGTLRKSGANEITLAGRLRLQGDLHVAEGSLRLTGAVSSGEPGAIRVDAGATLTLATGRNLFTVGAREFRSEGVVDGPIRFSGNSTIIPAGSDPVFTSDVTVGASTLEVGGAGFTVGDSPLQPVRTQLRLEYDASADTPGDAVWSEATGSANVVNFVGGAASPVSVSDAAFPALTAAYEISQSGRAEGLNGFFDGGVNRSRQDATFELVFRVDSTSAGSDQVLFEAGGAARGVAFVLNGDTLSFNVDGDASDLFATTTVAPGWNHAIGVVDLTAGDDSVTLYLNGQEVSVLTGETIDRWAGGNQAGLGGGSSSVTGVSSGTGAPFHGALALARYYENAVFDGDDAMQNYLALTTQPDLVPTSLAIGGDLAVDGASEMRLDLAGDGVNDRIDIEGNLVVTGATLTIAHVGSVDPAVGAQYDLFDFASASIDFDAVDLPTLDAGLAWRLDRLAVDGVIEVVLAGDMNGDGTVDSADYTIWRDSADSAVQHFTAGDANGDGFVDDSDLALWNANFGATASAFAAAVPEPAGAAFVLSVLATLVPNRRRR